MSPERKATFWAAAAVAVAAALLVLGDVLLPFIMALAIAYLLDPVADRLEDMGMPRLVATLIILVVTLILIAIALITLVPIIVTQGRGLIETIPENLASLRTFLETRAEGLLGERFPDAQRALNESLASWTKNSGATLLNVFTSVWSSGVALLNVFSLMLITPVVAFYLLNDWDRMTARLDSYIPRAQVSVVRAIASEIDDVISGFIRGQLIVCLLLGIIYAVGLTLIGLKYGLLIGLIAGLTSFIPFVGNAIGLILAGSVALAQFWPEWMPLLGVAAVFVVGQALEGTILSPKIVGDSVKLHPVWLIFALFAFGYLFGFVGLLVAVPLAAAVGVLTRFGLRTYMESPLYTGTATADASATDTTGTKELKPSRPKKRPAPKLGNLKRETVQKKAATPKERAKDEEGASS